MGMRLPRKRNPETAFTAQVVQLLKAEGWWCMRFNTGAVKIGTRFVRFSPLGMSDLLCLKPGYPALFLELKSLTGRMELSQKDFSDRVRRTGHVYAVVRNAAELQAVLASLDA